MGADFHAVSEKVEHSRTFGEKLADFLHKLLERSAVAGTGGDPYLGPGLEILLGRSYVDMPQEPISKAQEIEDTLFIEVLRGIVEELAKQDQVLITGRGSNIILADHPCSLHVWLEAGLESRVHHIMEREKLNEVEAAKYINDLDSARNLYYRKFFKVQPNDLLYYNVAYNTEKWAVPFVAESICKLATSLTSATTDTDSG